MKNSKYALIPLLMVISVFAVWLSLTYLPIGVFGTVWAITIAPMVWTYLPWLIILGVATFVLLELILER